MLMDRKVDFVCCDNPTATKFTIPILAAVAEHERDIPQRPRVQSQDPYSVPALLVGDLRSAQSSISI
jgi:hypothetical protein